MLEQEEENINLIPRTSYNVKAREDAEPYENIEEEQLVTNLKNYIEKKVYMWDVTNSDEFQFVLPLTAFSEEKKINFTLFEESEITYDDSYISRELTPEQLEEIWEKGQFTVKSKNSSQPYVWQISALLHRGREGIKNSFCKEMGAAYFMLYALKYRFSLDPKRSFINFLYPFYFFNQGLRELTYLFLGTSRYSGDYYNSLRDPESYVSYEVYKKYQDNLLKEHPEIMVSIYYPKFKNLIHKIDYEFQKKWEDEKIIIEHQLQQEELTAKEIKEKLSDIKFNKLIEEYENSSLLDEKRKRYFIDILKAERIYSKLTFEHEQKKTEMRKRILEKIKKDYPIRSNVDDWLKTKANSLSQKEEKTLEEDLERKLDIELDQYPVQKTMIMSYRNFLKYKKQNMDLAIEKKKNNYMFVGNLQHQLLPPYKVQIDETETKINGVKEVKKYYNLKKVEYIPVYASCFLWRFKVIFMNIYYYAIINNLYYIGYCCCWNSSFGLKALWSREMYDDYDINSTTGLVSPIKPKTTYISALSSLLKSISKSRSDFEKSADKGFLGHKTGKLINLIENYVFKLIVGSLLIGILYPCFILLWTLFFAFLMVLWFFIKIFAFVLGYFFTILIYDFYTNDRNKNSCLPFIWIILKRFISQFFFHLIITFITVIGQIILSVLITLWALITYFTRSIYDGCTYCIIKCNGNIPKANTSLAWRISGPGTSRTVFYKLEIEEALLLVRAELEKFELDQFLRETTKKISEPETIHDKIVSRTLGHLNGNLNVNNKLQSSISTYMDKLNLQVDQRKRIYPYLSNQVRFTQDDLDTLLEATYDLVREFVQNSNLKSIWKQNGLVPDSWRSLTEKVLIKTFNTEDILINVDQSELKTDNKKMQNGAINQMYEDIGINRHMQKAIMKKSLFFQGSSDYEDEFYHTSKFRKRIKREEIDNAIIAPEIDQNCLNKEYFNIDYNTIQNEIKSLKEQEEYNNDEIVD